MSSRFSFRLKSLERGLPKVDVNTFLATLTSPELWAVIIAMHKRQLKIAREAGDRTLAADIAVVVKHDAARLKKQSAGDMPSPKQVQQLMEQLIMAEHHGPYPDDIEGDFRQRVKGQADDIRFDIAFSDMLDRLKAGEIVEFLDDNLIPIAVARELPRNDAIYWRNIQFTSPYIVPVKQYFDGRKYPRKDEDNDIIFSWREWRNYCREADKRRNEIAIKSAPPKSINSMRPRARGAKCDQSRPNQRLSGGKNA